MGDLLVLVLILYCAILIVSYRKTSYHGLDESNPYVTEEVTQQARGYTKWINDNIWDLNKMKKQPEEIMVEMGKQCSSPYDCWYYDYCTRLKNGAGE